MRRSWALHGDGEADAAAGRDVGGQVEERDRVPLRWVRPNPTIIGELGDGVLE